MRTERAAALRRHMRGPRRHASTLFRLAPQLVPPGCAERLEGGSLLAGQAFHAPEAALELCVGGAQGLLRIDFEMQTPVGDGEEQISQLFGHATGGAGWLSAAGWLSGAAWLSGAGWLSVPSAGVFRQGLIDLAQLLQ